MMLKTPKKLRKPTVTKTTIKRKYKKNNITDCQAKKCNQCTIDKNINYEKLYEKMKDEVY